MKAYLHGEDGEEIELEVTLSNPSDDTHVIHFNEQTWRMLREDDSAFTQDCWWIRIVEMKGK